MATRNIKDAKDLTTGELIYFKGSAQATFMSDGRTVEEAVSRMSGGSIDTSNLATKDELAQKQDIISDIDTIRNNAANYKGTVTSAKVNNGRVDIDKTLNQIALKNNNNNDSKFFIGMSSKPTANIFNSSNMAELMAATKKAEAEQQEQLIRDTRQAENDVLDDLRALTERYIPETRHSTKSPGYIFVSALKDIINENDYTRLDNIKQYLKEASQARKTLVKAYNENVPPIIALDNNMALLCTGPARVQTFFNTNHKGLLNEMEDQTINEFATKAQEGDKKQSYMRLNDALDFYVELVNKYFKEGGER